MHTFIDLFCGIGGFRLALEKKGAECVFSSDMDLKAQEQYKANFNDLPRGDIRRIPASVIPRHDILCAGFPCQSFSISGKRTGLNDARGRLFYEIIRIAEYHKPYILLLENVRHILSIDKGDVLKLIRNELDRIGYTVHFHVLNSSHFGIPQGRKRVYFVCLRKGTGLSYRRPEETYEPVYLEDIIMDNSACDENHFLTRSDVSLDRSQKENQLRPIRIGIVEGKKYQCYRIYSIKGHAVTMMSCGGGGLGRETGLYLVEGRVRKLHIQECKSVMGFPQAHKVSRGKSGFGQLGNAVIPAMIEQVYDNIKKAASIQLNLHLR